jgi:hypothetical protein
VNVTTTYKGETQVRKANLAFESTKEEILEYTKCHSDIIRFASHCHLKTDIGGLCKIKLRDYQEECLNLFEKNKYVVANVSRQSGTTIVNAIHVMKTAIFNNDKNILLVANLKDSCIELIDKVKIIYCNLPFYMKPGVKSWNQRSIVFDNGCTISISSNKLESENVKIYDYVYINEAAHIPTSVFNKFYTELFPQISSKRNARLIIQSTPNGINHFYKIYSGACLPDSDPSKNIYKSMSIYWHQVQNRLVTYIMLSVNKLSQMNITKEEIFRQITEKFPLGNATLKYSNDNGKDIITISNNNYTTEEIKNFIFHKRETGVFNNMSTQIPINELAYVTSWKEETIKEIGGLDVFEQEYNLKFKKSKTEEIQEIITDYSSIASGFLKLGNLESKPQIKREDWDKLLDRITKLEKEIKEIKNPNLIGDPMKVINNPGQVEQKDVLAYLASKKAKKLLPYVDLITERFPIHNNIGNVVNHIPYHGVVYEDDKNIYFKVKNNDEEFVRPSFNCVLTLRTT